MAAGWGQTALQKSSKKLNEICIPLARKRDCEEQFRRDGYIITQYMFCAGKSRSGQNVCHGDSGGPLVAFDEKDNKWILGGVVSWGDTAKCGEKYEVFAKVSKLVKWVRENAIFDLEDPFSS